MKFLCVPCDRAMKLDRTLSPDGGSLTVVFSCPSCSRQTAMLTNSMESQIVRALGVRIGGRPEPSGLLGMVRGSLDQAGEDGGEEGIPPSPGPRAGDSRDDGTGSKCPFAGVAEEVLARDPRAIVWTAEAEERIGRVPPFARAMVRKGVEMHAREQGYREITSAVIDEVKDRFGM